jgi:hypothetical protein
MSDLLSAFAADRESINKYHIARTVLERINAAGDAALAARREIIKRIVEWEDFSICWPSDQLKAKGLVSELRRVVQVKDSFARMKDERDKEVEELRKRNERRIAEKRRWREEIASIRMTLFSMFGMDNPQRRGVELERVLNRLFRCYGILLREDFKLRMDEVRGVVEQIDGVIELDGNVYLVEMKWESEPLGRDKVSSHLVRVFNRGHSRGILISASGYTEPAVQTCKESLHHAPFCLCLLEEIVFMLEQEADLMEILRSKVQAALIEKNPLHIVRPKGH